MTGSSQARKRISVAVISGFLGSGKTTLVDRILNNRDQRRIAVIVNDLGEHGADSRLLKGASLKHHRDVIELKNGCICCSLRDELAERITQLAKSDRFDYVLVESTGISEPLPVAAGFFADDDLGSALEDLVRVDAMITVVDAHNFPLEERHPAGSAHRARPRRRSQRVGRAGGAGRVRQHHRHQQDGPGG